MSYTQREVELLTAAVTAATSGQAIYALATEMTNLERDGLVIGNATIIDETSGCIAFMPTQNGIAVIQASNAQIAVPVVQPTVQNNVAQKTYTVGTDFMPPIKGSRLRKAKGGRVYPFDELELNGWIFVPATEDKPNPSKSLASTISSANKRYGKTDNPKFFKIYKAKANQAFGAVVAPSDGAFIVRLVPPLTETTDNIGVSS